MNQLDDERLVPELKKRLHDSRLTFIITDDCREQINKLSLNGKRKQLDPESASKLWAQLVENAVTYLKMSDPREWEKSYGEPSTPEEMSSLKAFGIEKLNKYFVQFREFEKILYGAENIIMSTPFTCFGYGCLGLLFWMIGSKIIIT